MLLELSILARFTLTWLLVRRLQRIFWLKTFPPYFPSMKLPEIPTPFGWVEGGWNFTVGSNVKTKLNLTFLMWFYNSCSCFVLNQVMAETASGLLSLGKSKYLHMNRSCSLRWNNTKTSAAQDSQHYRIPFRQGTETMPVHDTPDRMHYACV